MKDLRKPVVGSLLVTLLLAGCGAHANLTKVRVGYLHTVAVDAHIWIGLKKGYFEQQGLDVEPVLFQTGIAESQALAGGSSDVAVMGAVLSNFPARGQGEVFLANDVEHDTAQVWVQADSGIRGIRDLAGKTVATTIGTTAHVFLYTALKAHGVDPKLVKIVNSSMPDAVSAFVAKRVPAVVLWVPFDLRVKANDPDARMIDHAGNYFPQAAILGGWVANNSFYAKHKDVLIKIAKAWMNANSFLVSNTDEALKIVYEAAYTKDGTLEDVKHNFEHEKVYSNDEWYRMYRDGTVARWIGRVEQVFVELGGLPQYNDVKNFFAPDIYEQAYEQTQRR